MATDQTAPITKLDPTPPVELNLQLSPEDAAVIKQCLETARLPLPEDISRHSLVLSALLVGAAAAVAESGLLTLPASFTCEL